MEKIYDVVVVGGAFSGASTALLLKRRLPGSRILIVEKAAKFDRKVGESTTEVSSCFMTRILGISTYLGHHHLPKQGLRMWFSKSPEQPFEECVEMGARYNSRLSGFQVDRAKLDEYLLGLAVEAGCELWRPAKLSSIETGGIGNNTLRITNAEGETVTVTAKWVVDASGRAAVLARRMNLLKAFEAHPVHALWGRFSGVKDWDGFELREKYPCYAQAARTSRSWATNHLMGLGWWCWIIPLKGGDYSIGLVYDSRLYKPPEGASIAARLRAHFLNHPVGREILGDATLIENDQRSYSPLPYLSEKCIGPGWAIVGDAGNFMDPFYSPGLDFCSFTAHAAHTMIARSLEGEDVVPELEKYNSDFQFCFNAWFETIYRDKYYYMGDAELMAAAFQLDIAMYHLGPVRQVYANPGVNFSSFPFGGIPGKIVAKLMSFYNRRLSILARRKIAAGCYGNRNANWRLLIPGFVPDASVLRILFKGLRFWWLAELRGVMLRKTKGF